MIKIQILLVAVICLFVAKASSAVGVCNRIDQVANELTRLSGKGCCSAVTAEDLAKITELNLLGKNITDLGVEDLAGLQNLVSLDLAGNQLTEVKPEIFKGTPYLNYLDLGDNKITAFPAGTFAYVRYLKMLNIYGNNYTELNADVFQGGYLQFVALGNDSLQYIAGDIFSNAKNLVSVYIYAPLKTLPATLFNGQARIKDLHIAGPIESLPDGLFDDLYSVEEIEINDTALITLPEKIFKNNMNLELLDMRFGKISYLPEGIFEGLRNLVRVYLIEQDLGSADALKGVSKIKSLSRLAVGGNHFSDEEKEKLQKMIPNTTIDF